MGICFSKQLDKKKIPPPDFTKIDPTSFRKKSMGNTSTGSSSQISSIQKRPSVISASRVSNVNLRYHLQELNHNIRTRSNTNKSENAFDDVTTTSSNITRSTASASSASSSSGTTVSSSTTTTHSNDTNNNNLRKVSASANQTPTSKNAYVALFDYEGRTTQDISFKKGDILYIFDEDKKDNEWWLARLRDSSQRGYIPSQFVAQLDSLESQPWFFGAIKRMEAEKLLMFDTNRNGSFLIRISDGNQHAYSMSVRDGDSVKHYRIHVVDGKFYISKKMQFSVLNDLVVYYSKKADGLCVQLTQPCVKRDKPITKGLTHSFMKDHEMDRNKFRLEKKIGKH